jgi:glutamyl-Q tRNA(Asp) synthetase
MTDIGRFAPSTTGRAHPGTLLAALLCWLDARSRGGHVILRLEDLDPERCRPEFSSGLRDDLTWFGLDDWDAVVEQHDREADHAAALDILQEQGRLYPSPVSRSALQALGRRGPDGGFAYDNRDRDMRLPSGGWRACRGSVAVRCRLDDGIVSVRDESGRDLSCDVVNEMGDPVVLRRDGACAYHLVCVVDDAASQVTRVIRGRDLATATAPQVALQRVLDVPTPVYRHHALLLEQQGGKLAKLHQAIAAPDIRVHMTGNECCAYLARMMGIASGSEPCRPQDLLAHFTWDSVRDDDVVLRWVDHRFAVGETPRSPV